MARVIVCALAALLAGCMNLNPNSHALKFEAGPQPSQEEIEAWIHDYLAHSLKDPDSLKQYRFISLQKTRWLRGAINGGGADEGWLACYEYNAKNSYGGYNGVQTHGMVFRHYPGERLTPIPGAMTQIMTPTC
jgi:hypothetical protein